MIFFFISIMIRCVYSVESLWRCYSNEDTQHTFMLKIEKRCLLAQWVTLTSSNYPCLEHSFMVPKCLSHMSSVVLFISVFACKTFGWSICSLESLFYFFSQASAFSQNMFDAMYFYGLWINYTRVTNVNHRDGRAMVEFSDGFSFVCKCWF